MGLAFSLVGRVDVGVIGVGLLWAAPVAALVAVGVIVWRKRTADDDLLVIGSPAFSGKLA
jgi:hypothetical protein